MFRTLLLFQWKTAVRAPMWQKNLILNLVIGFFLFFTAANLLMIGLLMDQILADIFPDQDPLELFNSVLLYYFLIDLFVRFLMQSLPRLAIESFLHLPIRKSRIIHFMEGRTVFDIFNLIPLLIFIPVMFTIVIPTLGHQRAIIWFISLLALIMGNNFLAVYLKRLLGTKPVIVGLALLLVVSLILADRIGWIGLTSLSADFLQSLVSRPILLLIPLAWMSLNYLVQYRFLKKHLYPDEIQKRKSMEIQTGTGNKYLRSFGLTGTIFSLEMKLYWRNKRPRTIIYMLPLFLLYGLMFYPKPEYEHSYGFLMFVGIFMVGGMMLNYGNYAFGYESTYFDTLLTKKIDFQQYIKVKYSIAVLTATVCFILTIPYIIYGYRILLINLAMYFYNIGCLAFVLLYMATYNKNRMDLSRGGTFNYQGIGVMNWLAIIPAFLLPFIIYLPFRYAGYPVTGIIITGLTGVVGLCFSRSLIRIITRNFLKRKYVMAHSFRQRL